MRNLTKAFAANWDGWKGRCARREFSNSESNSVFYSHVNGKINVAREGEWLGQPLGSEDGMESTRGFVWSRVGSSEVTGEKAESQGCREP